MDEKVHGKLSRHRGHPVLTRIKHQTPDRSSRASPRSRPGAKLKTHNEMQPPLNVPSRSAIRRFVSLIHRHRGLLVLAVLFIGVLWVTEQVAREAALQRLLDRGNHDLALYMANIRRELDSYKYLPRLLTNDHRLRNLLDHPWNPEARDEVDRYLDLAARVSGASDIYLMDRAGLTLASSNWQARDSFVGDNYSFRPYFQEAVKGGLGRYYALGWSSGRRGYYFAYPVSEPGGTVNGVVVVKVSLESLEQERGDNKHYEFVVTGPHDVIFLSTRPEWRYHTLTPIPKEVRRQIIDSRRYAQHSLTPLPIREITPFGGEGRLVTLRTADGDRTYLEHGQDMTQAGWRVHILTNTGSVVTDVIGTVLLVGFVMGATFLTVLILYQRRQRLAERLRYEHAAMETAAANELRVQTIIDSTRAGLITLDPDGRIETFNTTAETLLGRPASDVVGGDVETLLKPADGFDFRRESRTLEDRPGPLPVLEVTARRADGTTLPLELAINRTTLPEGVRYIVTLHDITERKEHEAQLEEAHHQLETRVRERTQDLLETNRRLTSEIEERRRAEEELRRTRDELIQAAKLAAIGQLSAGINHELNQPLTAIRFYVGNARSFLQDDRLDEARDNLNRIDQLSERMGRIINQLKLFARKSSGPPVPVSLSAVIDGAVALLTPKIKRREVEVRKPPQADILCMGDMVRLEQVFVNLIGNAIQAMEGNARPIVEIDVTHLGERVRASIRDHGPGIEEEDLAQIFDPFFTTKKAGDGLGLGLSISMRIVEELDGTMSAFNHPEGGAVLAVELPAAPARESVNE